MKRERDDLGGVNLKAEEEAEEEGENKELKLKEMIL